MNYYKFNLNHAEIVKKMKIEVTGLHGEVTLMSSKEKEYPDINENDHVSFWNYIIYEAEEGSNL